MGRRKIEIQPITHERNRSVTFQKRKNGLFKKAYELGVLCSVDVAVILFEQRPGHPPKLYQYGSSDIHEIVERQMGHDGDNDTRGPGEFAGGATGGRNEDDEDGDEAEGDGEGEDDGDDLGPPPIRVSSRSKRRGDGQLKPTTAGILQPDLDYRMTSVPSHMSLGPPQPHLPSPSHPAFGLSTSMHHHHQRQQHPISSDRLRPIDQYQDGQHQSKRPRLDVLTAAQQQQHLQHFNNRGGTQSSVHSPVNAGRSAEYGYHPGTPQFQGPPSSHQYPPQYAFSPGSSLSSHPQPYPVSSPGQPPSFISLGQPQAEFSFPPPPPPPGSVLSSSSSTSRPGSRRESGQSYPNSRPSGAIYGGENGNRNQNTNGMYTPSPGPGTGSGGSADQSAGELLAEIFSATSSSRARDQLDWPVHGHPSSGSSGGSGEANSAGTSAPTREEDAPAANSVNSAGVWLDFLSASTATSPASTTDNGTAPHRNARITSTSTPVPQTRTPVTEGSGSGVVDASGTGSGLALFKMEPGNSNDGDPRIGGSIEDRQKSGDA